MIIAAENTRTQENNETRAVIIVLRDLLRPDTFRNARSIMRTYDISSDVTLLNEFLNNIL